MITDLSFSLLPPFIFLEFILFLCCWAKQPHFVSGYTGVSTSEGGGAPKKWTKGFDPNNPGKYLPYRVFKKLTPHERKLHEDAKGKSASKPTRGEKRTARIASLETKIDSMAETIQNLSNAGTRTVSAASTERTVTFAPDTAPPQDQQQPRMTQRQIGKKGPP